MAKKTTVKFPAKIVNNYLDVLKKEINVHSALLFGSFAYGQPHRDSDVDLVVISSDFAKQDFDDRLDWLTLKRIDVADTIAMDVIGYTPKEFATIEKHSAIMARAKQDGKWLA